MDLSLKQMQDAGLSAFFTEKTIDQQIQKKLEEQRQLLEKPVKKTAVILGDVLASGGTFDYRFEGKKYKLSVLTPEDMNIMDNIDNFTEQVVVYNIPPMYKFHVTTALGNKLFIQAKTMTLAQNIVDAIFGKNYYRISASKI